MAIDTGIRKLTPRHVLLTAGAVVALGVVVGLGSWRLGGQGHTTHPAAVTQAQPAVAAVQRARVITDCPCAIPALGGVPLEAFPNGCPCDVLVPASGAPASEWPASFRIEEFPQGCPCNVSLLTGEAHGERWPASTRLEAFPNGCPCLPATVLPTAVPASH
jgi:hypothetical protein